MSGPELVGSYAFALLINAPVFMFLDMQLKNIYLTADESMKDDLFKLRLLTISVGLFYSIIIALFFPSYFHFIIIVGLIKSIDLIIDFNIGVFQDNYDFNKAGFGLFLKAFLSLFGYLIGVFIFSSVKVGLLFVILIKILNLFIYDYKYIKRPRLQKFSFIQIFHHSKNYYPLGFVLLLLSLNANVPRFFIENKIGVYELGIYAAIAYFMTSGRTVFNSLIESFFPILRKHFKSDRYRFNKTLILVLISIIVLCFLGAIVGYFFAEELIILFYSDEYLEMNVFYILLASLFIYFFAKLIDLLLILYSAYHFNMYSLLVSFLVNILSVTYLIDKFNLSGAALSFFFAMLSYLISNIFFLKICSKKTA